MDPPTPAVCSVIDKMMLMDPIRMPERKPRGNQKVGALLGADILILVSNSHENRGLTLPLVSLCLIVATCNTFRTLQIDSWLRIIDLLLLRQMIALIVILSATIDAPFLITPHQLPVSHPMLLKVCRFMCEVCTLCAHSMYTANILTPSMYSTSMTSLVP